MNESESNIPDQGDSDESDISDDEGTDMDPSTLDSPSRSRLVDSNDAKQAQRDALAPATPHRAAPPSEIVRAAPPPRSRLPSCTTVVFFVMLVYLVLAFYELYIIFTPEVSLLSGGRAR